MSGKYSDSKRGRATRVEPRKSPAQARSRATVDRIVDAAAAVLVTYGYDGASTARIAKQAGVGTGSVYDYFPNKESIILALMDRTFEAFVGGLAERVTSGELFAATPRQLVETAFGAMVDAMSERKELVRALVDEIPRATFVRQSAALRQRCADLIHMYVLVRRDQITTTNVDAWVWLVMQAAEALCFRYVIDEPPMTRDDFVAMATNIAVSSFLVSEPEERR